MEYWARFNQTDPNAYEKVRLPDGSVQALGDNPKAMQYRPIVVDTQPAVGANQVLVHGPDVVEPARVRETWTLRAKTQAELDNDADTAEREQLKASVFFDQLKAEAAGTSVLTAAQSRRLFARALVWLIKRA